jgi:hypothetical protein
MSDIGLTVDTGDTSGGAGGRPLRGQDVPVNGRPCTGDGRPQRRAGQAGQVGLVGAAALVAPRRPSLAAHNRATREKRDGRLRRGYAIRS